MKSKITGVGKYLILGVFVLIIGCFYHFSEGGSSYHTLGGTQAESGTAADLADAAGRTGEPAAAGVSQDAASGAQAAAGVSQDVASGAQAAGEASGAQTLHPAAAAAEGLQGAGSESAAATAQGTGLEPAKVQALAEASTPAVCYVYVCGEVNTPGVYELPEGSRVVRAIELAGGFTEQASTEYLNLAEPVYDGMKLQVPDRDAPQVQAAKEAAAQAASQAAEAQAKAAAQEAAQTAARAAGAGTTSQNPGTGAGEVSGMQDSPAGKVNINTATKEELMTLSGIGESRAAAIIQYRQEQGTFSSIEDIKKVSGIKEAAFAKIKDEITV